MAEEPNEVETDRIKANIERTRDNMSGTIDEIQERLTPSNLVQQAKESVREAAVDKLKGAVTTAKGAVDTASDAGKRALSGASEQGKRAMTTATRTARRAAAQARTTGTRAVSTARENPVGAALVASGVAWLMSSMTSRRRRRTVSKRWPAPSGQYRDYREHRRIGGRQTQGAFVLGVLGYYLISRQMASRSSSPGSFEGRPEGESGVLGQLPRSLVEPARELGASAQRLGRQAQRKAGEYAGRSKDLGQQVTRWVEENPLAVGAAVVALGTVVGLSVMDDDADWNDDRRDSTSRLSGM
jgi:Protein of unknown function (DUF3618)